MAKTLLIGVDGATFTVLDPLMARGVMPFLQELTDRGARAPLRSVMPPLTPPAWTSLMTGKRPGEHGVFDFFQKEAPDSEYFHFTSAHEVHSATIWSVASERGKGVISLNFPLMFPAPAVNGCVVPGGWMPWRQLRLGCHPPGLFDRLKTLPSFNPRELALDMTLEAKAIEGCPEAEYAEWIELHTRREQRWFEIARYLMQEEPAELVGVMFDGVDKLQHLCWRFLDPALRPQRPSPWERDIMLRCERYFERLDGMIAELVTLAGADSTVVLASDHGFGPTSDVFYVNSWLEQQGYLAWADGQAPEHPDAPEIGFSRMTRHIYELDWERTVAYAATPSSQGIHIVSRRPGDGGPMPRETYRRIRSELADALREIRHPLSGRPLVSELWLRDEAFAGPYEALAPDISILLDGGAAVSILRSETLFRRRKEPRGSHRWEGVFMASGPSINSDAVLDELSIVDVAPLVLYGLDLPVPADMAGRIPAEAFAPGQLERRPPRFVSGAPPEQGPEPGAGTSVYDSEGEETVLNRLRALGYVE